ncbi:MAG: hypothetical protein N2112_10015 [Gemmataceae bacterium]|jgi:hypothetical protein|nr:hypothetical protein [Gemmataceae bacterium]
MKRTLITFGLAMVIAMPDTASAQSILPIVRREITREITRSVVGDLFEGKPDVRVGNPDPAPINAVKSIEFGHLTAKIPVYGCDSSNWAGSVEVEGVVPFKVIYYFDMADLKLNYDATNNKVIVKMPPIRYHRPVPEPENAEITYYFKGWARARSSVYDLWEQVRNQPSQAIADKYARDNLNNAQLIGRPMFQKIMENQLKEMKPGVKVEIID